METELLRWMSEKDAIPEDIDRSLLVVSLVYFFVNHLNRFFDRVKREVSVQST
jgi:hypothetical protein